MVKAGDSAPALDLPDAGMEMVSLASFRGRKNVVLYFYPKDGTPGCTLQATDFSDLEDQFARHHTVVFGVSRDDCISHAEFRDKHGLTVQLLADSEGEACEKFGVLEDTIKDGVKKRCMVRSTIIIDKAGIVRHVMRDVNPKGHAQEVLRIVKGIEQ